MSFVPFPPLLHRLANHAINFNFLLEGLGMVHKLSRLIPFLVTFLRRDGGCPSFFCSLDLVRDCSDFSPIPQDRQDLRVHLNDKKAVCLSRCMNDSDSKFSHRMSRAGNVDAHARRAKVALSYHRTCELSKYLVDFEDIPRSYWVHAGRRPTSTCSVFRNP